MRGLSLNAGSSYLLNGNLLRGEQNVALENKEQVEILEGMSAIQSGMSTPGGVVNYVSKRPKDVQSLTLKQTVMAAAVWRLTLVDGLGTINSLVIV